MKKKISILVVYILVMSFFFSCSKKDEYLLSNNYNCFEKIKLFELQSEGWDIRVIGSNNEKTIMEKYRVEGPPENCCTQTELYEVNLKNGDMKKIIFSELEYENMIIDTKLVPNGNLIVRDCINGAIYYFDTNYQLISIKIGDEEGIYGDVEYEPNYSMIGCDNEFYYITHENAEGICEIDVVDYEANIKFTYTVQENETVHILENSSSYCRFLFEDTGEIYFFHSETSEWKRESTVQDKVMLENLSTCEFYAGDNEYDFYFREYGSSEISELTNSFIGMKDGVASKIFDFDKMGIQENRFSIFPFFEGGFLLHIRDINNETEKFIQLRLTKTEVDYSTKKQKTILTIAALDTEDTMLINEVADFNIQSEEYYIELKDYGKLYEYEDDAIRAMQLDLTLEGNLDGILLTNLDKRELKNQGYLFSLNEYLEISSNCSAETIQDFIWNNLHDENGHVYSLYPEFWLYGCFAGKDISLKNLEQYTNEGKIIFACNDAEALLEQLLIYSGNRYIDDDKKEMYFDEDFKELLAFTKMHKEDASISKGSVEAVAAGNALGYYEMLDFPYTFYFNEKIFLDGFHYINMCVDAPILIPGTMELGIVSTSDNKEGMYSFFDFIFDEKHYNKKYGNMSFPVLKNKWDDWKIRLTAKENYTDRYGEEIYVTNFKYSYNDIEVEISPMEEKDFNRMMNVLSKSVVETPIKRKYLDIVIEETNSYFNGDKDIDTVCNNIKNRISYAMFE